jgi:SAM-dependent methyltransferase
VPTLLSSLLPTGEERPSSPRPSSPAPSQPPSPGEEGGCIGADLDASEVPRPRPLITPALFSQPPPRPPGEEGEQKERSNRVPLSRPAGGGGRGDRGEGLGGGGFDSLASDYDANFTATSLGMLLRQAVHRRLDSRFAASDRILELACGTGEDAVHLGRRGVQVVATDASEIMIETARAKAAGLETLIDLRQLAIEDLSSLPGPFDGAFSNFGGLNCVEDLTGLGRTLGDLVRPGGLVLLCVMGPLVPWEWAGFLLRGELGKAFRRLRRGGVEWRGITVRYPNPSALRRAFAPAFHPLRLSAVGALLPPTEWEPWARTHPLLLASLARWERRLETVPPLPWLADHYLLELERR